MTTDDRARLYYRLPGAFGFGKLKSFFSVVFTGKVRGSGEGRRKSILMRREAKMKMRVNCFP